MVAAGIVVVLSPKVPWLGRLPGDVQLRGRNWSFSFPIVTCLLVSVALTLLFWLIGWLRR